MEGRVIAEPIEYLRNRARSRTGATGRSFDLLRAL